MARLTRRFLDINILVEDVLPEPPADPALIKPGKQWLVQSPTGGKEFEGHHDHIARVNRSGQWEFFRPYNGMTEIYIASKKQWWRWIDGWQVATDLNLNVTAVESNISVTFNGDRTEGEVSVYPVGTKCYTGTPKVFTTRDNQTWDAGTEYTAGSLFIVTNRLYKFNGTGWEDITATIKDGRLFFSKDKAELFIYVQRLDKIVSISGAGSAGSTASGLTAVEFALTTSGSAPTENSPSVYPVGTRMWTGGKIFQTKTDGTWDAGTDYTAGKLVIINNKVHRSNGVGGWEDITPTYDDGHILYTKDKAEIFIYVKSADKLICNSTTSQGLTAIEFSLNVSMSAPNEGDKSNYVPGTRIWTGGKVFQTKADGTWDAGTEYPASTLIVFNKRLYRSNGAGGWDDITGTLSDGQLMYNKENGELFIYTKSTGNVINNAAPAFIVEKITIAESMRDGRYGFWRLPLSHHVKTTYKKNTLVFVDGILHNEGIDFNADPDMITVLNDTGMYEQLKPGDVVTVIYHAED